jgi:signal transduction histidine kinase
MRSNDHATIETVVTLTAAKGASVGGTSGELLEDRSGFLLFEHAPIPQVQLSASGNVVLANAQARRMFGSENNVVGRPIRDWILEGQLPVAGAEQGSEVVLREGEHSSIRKVLTVSNLPDGGWLVVFSNVSADSAMLADLAQARQMATDRSLLLANLSHEVRTPLTGVMGTMELLQGELLPESAFELVQVALRSARQLNELLNDILDLSRLEAGRVVLHAEAIRVEDLCESAITSVLGSATHRGLELVLDLDPATPQVVLGDMVRLRQILGNLLGNAVKFCEHGLVALEVEACAANRGGGILFRIRDEGPGMSEEQVAHLFERYHTGEAAERHGGTGLGLAIVRELVHLMQGHIHVESRIAQGTCFTVWIPLENQPATTSLLLPHGTFVVVDDRPRSRALLTRDLEQQAQTTFQTESWSIAGDLLQNLVKPAVVMAPDFMLNRPEAAKALNRASAPVRVVAVRTTLQESQAIPLADRSVLAPVLPSRLRSLIRELFRR